MGNGLMFGVNVDRNKGSAARRAINLRRGLRPAGDTHRQDYKELVKPL